MNTAFLLLAEFGAADVPVELVAERYLALDAKTAKARAARGALPFPAYRCGSQKTPWLVRITDLASWLDEQRAKAVSEWNQRNGVLA